MPRLDDAVAVEVMRWSQRPHTLRSEAWYDATDVFVVFADEWCPSENDWQLWQVIGEALKEWGVSVKVWRDYRTGEAYARVGHDVAYSGGYAKRNANKAVLRAALAWARAGR